MSRWIQAYGARFGSPAVRPAAEIAPGGEGYLLDIPKLHLQAVVHLLEPAVLAGVNTTTLRRYGVGQVPYTPDLRNVSPGGDGTAAITGHRTTSGAPFRHLDQLAPGDIIVIRKGTIEQQWIVVSSTVVLPRDVGAIRSRPGDHRLVLLACDPPFSAKTRIVVYATLALSAPQVGEFSPSGHAATTGRR